MTAPATSTALPFSVAMLGIASFAAMDVLMKVLAIELGTYNALLWRTSLALVLAAGLFIWFGVHWPDRRVLRLHVLRGTLTALMATLFFWGLVRVPLAEAIGLSFIAPLVALYLAAVLLGERISRKSVLASVVGLSGALVIVTGKLSGEYSDDVARGIAAILASALLYAYNLILQRQQALVAPPVEIAFYQHATMVTVYLAAAPLGVELPPAGLLPEIAAAALLGISSILLLSWAYARAEASILIPVEYTAFIWAAILGWLVFEETVTATTLAGTALIVTGCLVAARQKPERVDHVESTAI